MGEQNPLSPIVGPQPRRGEDREQQDFPRAELLGNPLPPPPPLPQPLPEPAPATPNQSVGITAPAPAASLLKEPIASQSLLSPLLTSSSLLIDPLLLAENAIPQSQDGGSQRREFDRKPLPFGGVAPEGEMAGPTGQKWHIRLWDVSMGGLCVVVEGAVDQPLGSLFAFSVYESFGLGSAFFNAQLRWRSLEADNTYLGLEFEDQDLLKKGCFLMDFVHQDKGPAS